MTNFQSGDLVLVDFPFTSSGQGKPRPALVVLDTGDADVILARVTTQSHTGHWDVPIADWQTAGLLAPSVVRLHKVATIAKAHVLRPIGTLSSADRISVGAVLRNLSANW